MAKDTKSTELGFPEPASLLLSHTIDGRESPLLWIKSLSVYKSWKPTPANLLRTFTLRRGLNILWADPSGSNANSANRLSGHSAGKSTFCRLLRYALGESPAGTKDFIEGFRSKFEDGWVVAEVSVNNQWWLVVRPLSGSGHHSFALPDTDERYEFPDAPLRQGWKDYLKAINTTMFSSSENLKLPDSEENLDWSRLLQWLSRDQEAHYSGLLDWRHKDSEHGSPPLSATDRGHIVRLVMGVLGDKEQKLLQRFSKATRDHESKTRGRPAESRVHEQDQLRLETALRMPIPEHEPDLLTEEIDKAYLELVRGVDTKPTEQRHERELAPFIEKADNARISQGLVQSQVETAEYDLALEEARKSGSTLPKEMPKSKDPVVKILNKLGPFPGYCSVPEPDARKHQCRAYREKKNDEDGDEALTEIAKNGEDPVKAIHRAKTRLGNLQKQLETKKEANQDAQTQLAELRKRHVEELDELRKPKKQAESLRSLHDSFLNSQENLKEWDDDLKKLEESKKNLEADLARESKAHQETLDEVQKIFNELAHRLLGEVVTGSVRFKGKMIEPELHFHGKRNSAALKVTKWLIFDLTALIFSMRNKDSLHPRFLIHDSPREADLAQIIYAELFKIASSLEQESNAAAFQYIVTTTEPPPEEFRNSPWLLQPVLDSSNEKGRLLGVDLDSP